MNTTINTPGAPREALNVEAIFPEIAQMNDLVLRGQVIEVWQELWSQSRWRSFDDLPTSKEIAYPARPHSQCVLTMALGIADAFERHHGLKIDRNVLIAAAILQDASKVVEYDPGPDGQATHTAIGKSFPHAFWCAHVALSKGVPLSVCHIMVTHSPAAAKFPDSIEGKILYYVDQLDVIAIHGDKWVKRLFAERPRP